MKKIKDLAEDFKVILYRKMIIDELRKELDRWTNSKDTDEMEYGEGLEFAIRTIKELIK